MTGEVSFLMRAEAARLAAASFQELSGAQIESLMSPLPFANRSSTESKAFLSSSVKSVLSRLR